MSKRKSRKN